MGFSEEEIESLNSIRSGDPIRQHQKVPGSPDPVDVVYTTRWHSMSEARREQDWLARFEGFAVTKEMMLRFSGSRAAVFMHDLPAVRGQEVDSEVLDGTSAISLAQSQIRHKESAAASALLWTTGRY